MSENNEEKAIVSQGKNNKRRRFRPRNKNKNSDVQNKKDDQNASDVLGNFFAPDVSDHAVDSQESTLNGENGRQKGDRNRNRRDKNNVSKEQVANKNPNKQAANAENQIAEAKAKKQRKPKKNLPAKLSGNEQWQQDIASAMEANKAVHELRLEPMKYLNSTDHKIRITPLGGLGEIGGNMTVFETDTSAIIVDIGMSFPSESMHGVDILIPDFDYVRKIKDKIKGVVITHAHEDHIGAVPYFYKEFKFPIYATPLPLGMINNKFE